MHYPQKKISSFLKVFFLLLTLSTTRVVSSSAQENMTIGGTGGALATMKELASEFQRSHSGIAITVLPSLGSGGGIKAVLAGALDVGISSRPLNDAENGAVTREFGRTPFVFTVRKNNPLSGFTLKEIEDIYSGRTESWPDGRRIRVVLRPAAEYDTSLLKSMSPEMNRAVTETLSREGMIVAITDQDSAEAIEKVPGALGTITLAQLISEKRPFRVLSLDGVRPGPNTSADGSYPYFKTYYLVTKPGAKKRAVKEFTDFIFSARGREILIRCGFEMSP